MQRTDALVFIHKWVPAESVVSDPVTLLLLHGAGGDENALLSVGKELWPGAALLALRGKVFENDGASSFGRFTDADMGDLKSRTEELAQFIGAASKRYSFRKRRVIVVGYANGANLAASLIRLHPHYLAGAVPGDGASGPRSDSGFQPSFGVYRGSPARSADSVRSA